MMKLGKCFLPVNDTWHKFIKNAESAFDVKRQDISTVLTDIALQTLETSSCDQKTDLSLMQLDWTIRPSKKIPDYLSTGNLTPKRRKMLVKESALKDKPKWFCDLWNSDLERIDIGLGMQVVPLLLGVKYLDRHIMHHPVIKWFYGVPKDIVDKKLKELSIDQSNDGKGILFE